VPVGMLLDTPDGSQETYDALTTKIFGTLQPTDLPEGLILHTAGPREEGGWRVIDVWESEEAFWRFFDAQVLPAALELGQAPTDSRPTFFAIHNVIGHNQ
jgi:hypothetical protein